jgi:hypothetical protein
MACLRPASLGEHRAHGFDYGLWLRILDIVARPLHNTFNPAPRLRGQSRVHTPSSRLG